MSRPTPRRPASSRGQTPRPRKLAGRTSTPAVPPVTDAPDETAASEPASRPERPVRPETSGPGVLARPKTTRVLIAVLALVTIALVAEFAILLVDQVGGKDDKAARSANPNVLTVPKGRPIIAGTLQVREGVEKAAAAAREIVSVDYKKYDDEVKTAADLMTARFEKQYRTTAEDIKDQVVGQQTTVQASVVAQGAVGANRTRLQALVFLNQVVERTRDGKKQTVVTPFKVLVTMVHTDHGWLVDALDTDAPVSSTGVQPSNQPSPTQDKTN